MIAVTILHYGKLPIEMNNYVFIFLVICITRAVFGNKS